MSLCVKLSPVLRKYVPDYQPESGIQISRSGIPVSQIIEELDIPPEKVTSVMVNHRPGRSSYVVQDGDHIFLAMIIGGG